MPDRLGRYPVHRRIGAGGFATVWLAYDEQLDSPVAVKVLADNWSGDEHIRLRFLEEGRYLRRVESPHVVSVYDAGELDDGRPYLVMTYADQGTLADRLGNERLTPAQALTVVRHVAAGLQALHDRGILHRDIKPANVLFRSVQGGSDVRALVGDLGLGKALDVSSRLTLAAGTPSFVAPEQAASEPLDARADQYSLATLAFLLLSGRKPFDHLDLQAAAEPGPVPPLSIGERHFDASVESVVRRGLAVRPGDRYPSVTEFAEALTDAMRESSGDLPAVTRPGAPWLPMDELMTVLGSSPAGPPRPRGDGGVTQFEAEPSVAPRRGRRWALLTAACVLAATGAGASAYLLGKDDGTPSGTVALADATGKLSVTVPAAWQRHFSRGSWVPPDQPRGAERTYPSLSAGSAKNWTDLHRADQGVFAGVLPSGQLPGKLPGHPECDAGGQIVGKDPDGHDQATIRYTGCPEGVVIEQATMLDADELLWVQVRGSSIAQASQVLRTIETRGFS